MLVLLTGRIGVSHATTELGKLCTITYFKSHDELFSIQFD